MHLSLEVLARLVEERPDPAEAAHLAGCPLCREELAALREQTEALAGLPALEPPAGSWETLEARLRDEGLIRQGASPRSRLQIGWLRSPRLLPIAASVAVFVLGGGAGWAVRSGVGPGGRQAGSGMANGDGAALVAQTDATPTSAAEAAAEVQRAEHRYLEALDAYNRLADDDTGEDPVARLAALQSIVLTTRAALNEAPADPVINGYHLAALSERDAVIRRMASGTGDPWF